MNQVVSSNYSFGDTDVARERLELLADVYEPSTRVFLVKMMGFSGKTPGFALDLGCGPGRTTALLEEVVGPEFVCGLDESPAFVEFAANRFGSRRLTFESFQLGAGFGFRRSSDFVFARHLFAHLGEPAAALREVKNMLTGDGVFGLEEVAELSSDDGVFRDYYAFVSDFLKARGHNMHIGAELASLAADHFTVLDFRVSELCLSPRRMAELHLRNVGAFRRSATEPKQHALFAAFEAHFRKVIRENAESPPVVCRLGQLIARPKSEGDG